MGEETAATLYQVQRYWDQMNPLYLETMTTFQAGLVAEQMGADPFRANNHYIAARAQIQAGHRILDAGCGVCGPSMDIARTVNDVAIHAVTLSPVQVEVAGQLVQRAGLADRITVLLGDYHHLPFEDDRFDRVLFLESFSYSPDPALALAEACRVLRPGGLLYLKDIFCCEPPLSSEAQRELEEFNRIFCSRPSLVSDTVALLADLGLQVVEQRDLSAMVSMDHVSRAMVESRSGLPRLTEFGRIHYRPFHSLPIVFWELAARKPG